MSYEDEEQKLREELQAEVLILRQALQDTKNQVEQLLEEKSRLLVENERVGHENSVLHQQLDEVRGPY